MLARDVLEDEDAHLQSERAVQPGKRDPGDERALERERLHVLGSRSWTSDLPHARAIICISIVIELRKCSTRSEASWGGSRLASSGSCVVIPTGQPPVWQWWQAPACVPSRS